GRGIAAALALGADGVCVGTRLIASHEAHAHDEYKRRVVAAGVADIARTCIFGPEWPDQPMRVIRNRVVCEWLAKDDKPPPPPKSSAVYRRDINWRPSVSNAKVLGRVAGSRRNRRFRGNVPCCRR